MSARNSFRKIAVTNGLKTTNLVANAALTNSYNLILPSTVPTIAGQSLISDTAGNLSWGSSTAVVSTFTGTTNPVSTPTNVTGLLFSVPSSSLTVYVALNATTNVYAMYSLLAYQKGSSSSWGLAYMVNGDTDDDPGVNFSITSGGQVQYVLGTVAGFTSIVFMWAQGTSVSQTLTSLALSSTLNVGGASTFTAGIQGTSLALSSTFNVTGLATHGAMSGLSLLLGNAGNSGSISSTVGSLLTLQAQTYTDTVTAASTTAAGTFSATYLGVPTLAAANTSVTTPTASTLTIAGAPAAGTNETITNTYAINVVGGSSFLGGKLLQPGSAFCAFYTGAAFSNSGAGSFVPTYTLSAGNSFIPPGIGTYGPSGGNFVFPTNGVYNISFAFTASGSSQSTAYLVGYVGPISQGGPTSASGYLSVAFSHQLYAQAGSTIALGTINNQSSVALSYNNIYFVVTRLAQTA